MNIRKLITVIFFSVIFYAIAFCGRDGGGTAEMRESGPAAASLPESSRQFLALLPEENAVTGWTLYEEPRFFIPDNLWEFINGAADGYLAYGFQRVVTADFAQESTDFQAVIDIYQMKDALNAFGIYSQERNPEYQFIDIGAEGYIGGTALNFWAGPYYVKVTVFERSDELIQEMRRLATHIAGKIGDPGTEPVKIGYFPQKNQILHTAKYIPLDVLGQSYFTNGFEAHYMSGDTEYKIVMIIMEDSDAAQEGLALYKQFITTSGKILKDLSAPGDGGFAGEDSFYGTMMAVRSGNTVNIILGVPSENLGNEALTELTGKIE